jgi:hypothetical protein
VVISHGLHGEVELEDERSIEVPPSGTKKNITAAKSRENMGKHGKTWENHRYVASLQIGNPHVFSMSCAHNLGTHQPNTTNIHTIIFFGTKKQYVFHSSTTSYKIAI